VGQRFHFANFEPEAPEMFRTGRSIGREDIETTASLSAEKKAAFAAAHTRAYLLTPLVKSGRFVACLTAFFDAPHAWSQAEIAIMEEAAERTWAAVERARAEAAVRVTEGKYRTLFETMDQGYTVAELIRDATGRAVDYRLLEMNPAVERLTGIVVAEALGR